MLEIKDSKIEGNSNGGLYIVNGDAHLEHVLIEENTGNQPALYVEGGGNFPLRDVSSVRMKPKRMLFRLPEAEPPSIRIR